MHKERDDKYRAFLNTVIVLHNFKIQIAEKNENTSIKVQISVI